MKPHDPAILFETLEEINARPEPFEFYTASDLWTDAHTSRQMLSFHLNPAVDASSRNEAFIERSVGWMASHFDIGGGTKIADFGCGPGLYTTRLARYQADVTGIDFSRRSIQYAREVAAGKGLSINYVNENYLAFETDGRFHIVIMIMCDFCALSPIQRKKMLEKFYAHLAPGGSILLDVYSLNAFHQRQEETIYEPLLLNGFWSPNKYYGFLNTFKYETEKVILDKYTIIEADRIRTVYNWLQYFTPEDLEKEFVDCGFAVDKLYSDVAGAQFEPESKEFAIIAKKP